MVDIAKQLFPNVWTLLAQWGATFILFVVFKKFLYKPVVAWLDKRAEKMQEDLESAKQKDLLATQEHQKAQQTYQQAVLQSAELINSSQQQAVSEKELILSNAKKEADTLLTKAKKDIDIERQQMLQEVQEEIVDVAMAASEKLLKQEVNQDYQREALDKFIAELRS